jgi:hypothetical protein
MLGMFRCQKPGPEGKSKIVRIEKVGIIVLPVKKNFSDLHLYSHQYIL